MNGLSSLNASQGLQASMRLFDRSAAAVSSATAQASNDLSDPTASSSGPDMVDAMVGMRLAANGVKANIAVVKTADEMLGTLLDMQA
jgi:flagellar hook protein FlgE